MCKRLKIKDDYRRKFLWSIEGTKWSFYERKMELPDKMKQPILKILLWGVKWMGAIIKKHDEIGKIAISSCFLAICLSLHLFSNERLHFALASASFFV